MPYADPADRRAYRRARYQRQKESQDWRNQHRDNTARNMRAYRQRQKAVDPEAWAQRVRAELDALRERIDVPGSPYREKRAQKHRNRYREKQVKNGATNRPFLSYDGEAINDRYVLLANTREYIENPHGLSTDECLEFLTRDYDDKPVRIFFASDYDVTMILRDVPEDELRQLATHNVAVYNDYIIRHFPGKILRVRSRSRRREFVYYDVWGFFQRSFLAVVDEYIARQTIAPTQEQMRLLTWGKEARTHFALSDLSMMRDYNRVECELLDAIMESLRSALNDASVRPTLWHGPGVIAEVFLDRARSRAHVERTFDELALRRAYFGGRIEVLQRGQIPGPVYDYDINSAYPHALASYRRPRGEYRTVTRFEPQTVGLYRVSWNVGNPVILERDDVHWPEDAAILGPFPYRHADGSITFPPQGRGIYHAVEVEAAIDVFGEAKSEHNFGIYVERGRVADLGDAPFAALVRDWYQRRREHKRAGNMAELAYKLGLNSAYGKLAQRVGKRQHTDLFLAGYITAHCRAQLLRATAPYREHVIAYATDGVLSRVPLPVDIGDDLGQFEAHEYDGVDVLMSGIYRLHKDGQYVTAKSRGWARLDFDAAMDALDGYESTAGYPVENTAFVTYRMAVHAPETYGPLRGRFVTRHRYLNPDTERKRLWYAPEPVRLYLPATLNERAEGLEKVHVDTTLGGGVPWTRKPQRSIARAIVEDGMIIALPFIEESAPLKDDKTPSEETWILGRANAEDIYLLDPSGLPLAYRE